MTHGLRSYPEIWLRVRHAPIGVLVMLGLTVCTALLGPIVVPLPLSFLESVRSNVPVHALTPAFTVIATGWLLGWSLPDLERLSTKPLARLDAALYVVYSTVLCLPLIAITLSTDRSVLLAASRSQVFALWATIIGAHLIGARATTILGTLSILIAPNMLPAHWRDHPPSVFVTLADGTDIVTWAIVLATLAVGAVLVLCFGIPDR